MALREGVAHIPPGDFDSLLTQRRRFRSAKACYPCRRRKVKCDLGEPCGTCTLRKHPDLCIYRSGPTGSPSVTQDKPKIEQRNGTSAATAPMIGHPRGLYVDPAAPYGTKVHIGPESLPTVVSASPNFKNLQPQPELNGNAQTIFELLCLQDASVTFPFTNLWKPDDGPEAVYSALPEDDVILDHIEICKRSLLRIMPSIIDEECFEETLAQLLKEREKSPTRAYSNPPSSCTPSWFAFLFGMLACGVQLASSELQTDVRKARVLACCSFQCLRFSNFLSYPDIETIQALLMLVNFLRNQADASASWSILGLTVRLAQALGLHYAPNPYDGARGVVAKDGVTKHAIWRSLMWQDTLVSLCYGRPAGITIIEDIPLLGPAGSIADKLFPFSEACHYLFVTANKIGRAIDAAHFTGKRLSLETITDFKNTINQIELQSVPHLQDITKCQHQDDYVDYYIFSVFSDSVNLCLSRPEVLCVKFGNNKELTGLYLARCRSVLRNYLSLLKLHCPMHRTWLFLHVALSCALTLGIVADTFNLGTDQALLTRFLEDVSQSTVCADVPAYENSLRLLREYVEQRF